MKQDRSTAGLAPALLNDTELARHLGVTVACLRKWRQLGTGPEWIKVGVLVRYRMRDVEAFLDACPRGGNRAA